MTGVSTTHPTYDSLLEQWERCRDCAAGEDAVKAKGVKYLPGLDSHKAKPEKYAEYQMRALFYNATGRTIDGLSGAIFQKAPSVEIDNEDLRKHIQDITLTDEPLQLFSLNATREYLTTGRIGILVDMSTELATTPRPYWVLYCAENIVNWRFKNLGGDKELSLVVLKEPTEEPDEKDEFTVKPVIQYRVLRLTDQGYTQQIYIEVDKNGEKEYIPGEILIPTRRGVPLNFIPFSLPWAINAPPLIDLVSVNLSHYRGVADLKHGLHFTALPTPWVSGQKGDSSAPLSIGSGTAWDLDVNGKAGMLEFTGAGLSSIRDDIQDMQKQMASLGARLLEEAPHYAETALSVSMRHSSDYATLRMIAQIVEQQISFALKTHSWWLSAQPLVVDMKANVELNKIFFDASLTADELRALLMALQAKTISYETFYERLANSGSTREGVTADEELAAIKADGDQFLPPEKPGLQQPDPKSTKPGSKPTPKPVK